MGVVSEPYENFREPGSLTSQFLWGPDLASAATVAPTSKFHAVTGAATISTITPPWAAFSGTIGFVGNGSWRFNAGGNIAIADAAAMSAGKIVYFSYSPVTAKWYPSSTVAA